MSYHVHLIPVLLLMLFGTSCNSPKKEKSEHHTDTLNIVVANAYASHAKLQWTAYKFTDRIGVIGSFDDFSLQLNDKAETPEKVLVSGSIKINVASVNSKNVVRDAKLQTYFFDLLDGDTIFGKILDAQKGKGILELNINAICNTVNYTYVQKNDTLIMTTEIDLTAWEGQKAINTLNQECYELHMGTDMVSKLWPNVDVVLSIPTRLDSVNQ